MSDVGGDDILTRDELAALLDLVHASPDASASAGAATPERSSRPRTQRVDPYDFRRRSLLNARELALLEGAMGRAARSMARGLGQLVRRPVTASAPTQVSLSARAFSRALPQPCALFVLGLASGLGADARAALVLEPAFVTTAVDLMLGGTGASAGTAPAPTELTRTSIALARRLVDGLLGPILERLDEVARVGLHFLRLETDPRVLSGFSGAEPLFVYEMPVQGGPLSGSVRLALPVRALSSAFEPVAPREPGTTARDMGLVGSLPVAARAVLGETAISVETLLGLEVGDVLRLRRRHDEPIEVRLAGGKTLHGRPGLRAGRIVLKLVDP